jgi:hypothetical protein
MTLTRPVYGSTDLLGESGPSEPPPDDQAREQLPLWRRSTPESGERAELSDAAAGDNKAEPIHRWVPWIAGYSAQFVRDVIDAYLPIANRDAALVLDPFAGVGTTLVEGLNAGCDVVGYEINAFAALAARAKINAGDLDPEILATEIEQFRTTATAFESEVDGQYAHAGADAVDELATSHQLHAPASFRSRVRFFSPPVEAKFLFALQRSAALPEPMRSLFRAALGATMVSYSNYTYEPSLSSRPGAGKALIDNASVVGAVGRKLDDMLDDVRWLRASHLPSWHARRRCVHHASYFDSQLAEQSVSLLITSPPYMNNYHYVRNTRPQLHWLDLIARADDVRELERASFGKFWQTVRQGPQVELAFEFRELDKALRHLRTLRPEKGHYGGRGWASYVATYFNDVDRFMRMLRHQLRIGGYAVIVVGNSIIQGIDFRVDHLMAQMAERHGLHVDDVRVVRTKRVGNSIIDSSVRNGTGDGQGKGIRLYDAAVILRR